MSFPPNGSGQSPNSYGASRGGSARPGPSRSGAAAATSLALDNMLRNQLKVSNPRDPKQIAEGLMAFYQDLPTTAGIRQEALGLPFLQTPSLPAPAPAQPTSSDAEFRIANGDVEKALLDLSNNPLTNDITPEMQGWGDSIRSAIAQGHAAARMGLDPTQRNQVIAMRRQLGEYARMARFVGSLSPGMTQNFRRLGRALDEVSAVMLVTLGESIASVGFATGYYLLQVPLQELQQRRDAVIFALRNFNGGAQQSYDSDAWPRGIDAYRRLYKWLEEQGQGDLRSLLLENEIAATMDTLIARAQNGTAEGLRALGVTAQLDIERFRRMAIVAPGAMSLEHGHLDRSPPMEAYLQALELFAETFRPASGLRLLRIARPAILLYGLYNVSQIEDDNALFDLITVRGTLATICDGLFPSNSARGVQPQVLLDMLLFELDRGIDLLALEASAKEGGPKEWRAKAFWSIVNVIVKLLWGVYNGIDPVLPLPNFLNPPRAGQSAEGPIPNAIASPNFPWFKNDLVQINSDFRSATNLVPGLGTTFERYYAIPQTKVPTPPQPREFKSVTEELRVNHSLEERWENLVRTIAPEAGDQQSIFFLLKKVIEQAAAEALGLGYDGLLAIHTATPLPPQYEQSLAAIMRKI